jgi:hypothetical protein
VLGAIKSEEQQEQSTRRNQHAAVLADVKAEPSVAAARPALTSSARVGGGNPRSGRKKACGAVEQMKAGLAAAGRRLGLRERTNEPWRSRRAGKNEPLTTEAP